MRSAVIPGMTSWEELQTLGELPELTAVMIPMYRFYTRQLGIYFIRSDLVFLRKRLFMSIDYLLDPRAPIKSQPVQSMIYRDNEQHIALSVRETPATFTTRRFADIADNELSNKLLERIVIMVQPSMFTIPDYALNNGSYHIWGNGLFDGECMLCISNEFKYKPIDGTNPFDNIEAVFGELYANVIKHHFKRGHWGIKEAIVPNEGRPIGTSNGRGRGRPPKPK